VLISSLETGIKVEEGVLLMAAKLTFPWHGNQYASLHPVANACYQIPCFSTLFKLKKQEVFEGKKKVESDDFTALNQGRMFSPRDNSQW